MKVIAKAIYMNHRDGTAGDLTAVVVPFTLAFSVKDFFSKIPYDQDNWKVL